MIIAYVTAKINLQVTNPWRNIITNNDFLIHHTVCHETNKRKINYVKIILPIMKYDLNHTDILCS